MEQNYNDSMAQLGYNQLVCDIFLNWESVKDEILIPGRKAGSGNGTIHVFLGAADSELQKEFPYYYDSVSEGEDPAIGAIEIKHYFMITNIVSMIGYVCKYLAEKKADVNSFVSSTLGYIDRAPNEAGLLSTKSLFKLSVGSSKLRPYFKQFENDGVFSKLIRQILLPNSSYKISLYKNEEGDYAAFWLIGFDWQNSFEADSSSKKIKKPEPKGRMLQDCTPLQQISYGAPGTGKSHEIDGKIKKIYPTKADQKDKVFRTTFHPDSDYATFVGCYKPKKNKRNVWVEDKSQAGRVVFPTDPETGNVYKEDVITYDFVPQAFTKAYVAAWKEYLKGDKKPVFLVIEEINRGNCAQIFGDLFQLLDREDDGFSSYPIKPDTDLGEYIAEQLKDFESEEFANVISGEELLLPSNLCIWATMNTSDQSLFPIDSAFKRRWDWKYVRINPESKSKWFISVNGKKYPWSAFLAKINEEIGETTSSEDKKLGFFFCKAEGTDKEGNNGTIPAGKFVGKVLFYIYNDVFKDYGLDRDFFKDKDKNGEIISFQSLFNLNGDVDEARIEKILGNLQIKAEENKVTLGTDENENHSVIEENALN